MSKSANKTSKENHNMTQEELANLMGLSVPTKTSATKVKNHSIKKVISDRLNEVMHKVLCDEFSEYYYSIGETMVSHKKKNGEVLSSFVKGYQLVIPSEESSFTSKDGQVTQGGFKIGNFTIYCCGFQTQETPYVIQDGKTIFFKDTIKK
tara:strand:- start:146 stop:595 length:450 start_codon:yes stop_codon:yes gene_type:complete